MMNRRELLLSSLSAAFLAACGGSNDEQRTKLLSSTAGSAVAGRPTAVFNTARAAKFISAYMDVIFSQNMLIKYRAAPNLYFSSLGFGASEIADHGPLLMALPVLTSADIQTAIDIDDIDFILDACKSEHILDGNQIAAFKTQQGHRLSPKNANVPHDESTIATSVIRHVKGLFYRELSKQTLPGLMVLLLAQVMLLTKQSS
jgi:hypothetical protein